MRKILTVLVVTILVFAVIRFKLYEKLNFQRLSQTATKETQAQLKKTQTQIEKTSNNVLGAAVGAVQNQVYHVAQGVNNFLDQKTQQVLNGATNGSVTVALVADNDIPTDATPIIMDFLQDSPSSLIFYRDRPYYLNIKNLPTRFCLFIDSQQYHVENGKLIKVSFVFSGSYQLSFNYCKENTSKFGEIVVK